MRLPKYISINFYQSLTIYIMPGTVSWKMQHSKDAKFDCEKYHTGLRLCSRCSLAF